MADELIPWPPELPLPIKRGYGYEVEDTLNRTPMASGPGKVRQTGRKPLVTHGFTLLLTFEQTAFLERWYENTLLGGVAWVAMPLHTGAGINLHAARIEKLGRFTHTGTRYSITGTFETQDRPAVSMTEEAFEALMGANAELLALIAAKNQLYPIVHGEW